MDLTTGIIMEQTGSEISQEQIEISAKILANMLLDYVNNGGSIAELASGKALKKGGEKDE